jgi:hypothetical protein
MSAEAMLRPAIDDALYLAKWTKLDLPLLETLYGVLIRSQRGRILRPYKSVEQDDVPDVADEHLRPMVALFRAAQTADLLGEYCRLIVDADSDRNNRTDSELQEIAGRIGYVGVPHGVLDYTHGLGNPREFKVLNRIFEATGYVTINNEIIGTAFLVRPDRVITSAHIALSRKRSQEEAIVFEDKPADNIEFVFPATPVGEQRARLHPYREHQLLACSKPFMNGRAQLRSVVTNDAKNCLDYALLLLDRRILDVVPVPIDGLDAPDPRAPAYVIGYMGGSRGFYATAQIRETILGAARLLHQMNTDPGASGSCCTADAAIPVGLHEGQVPLLDKHGQPVMEDGKCKNVNRAVMLSAIRRDLKAQPQDPLEAQFRVPGVALFDSALVHRLGKRGLQLANSEATRSGWEQIYKKALDADPSGNAPDWNVHPWFSERGGRASIETEFEEAARPDSGARVISIRGSAGSGKTFCLDILKARLEEPDRDLIRVDAIGGRQVIDSLKDSLAAPSTPHPLTRTSAGDVKYDKIEDLIVALASYGGRDRMRDGAAAPLFVAIDTGTNADFSLVASDWLNLAVALAARPWCRLIVCGLSAEADERLRNVIDDNVGARGRRWYNQTLRHATDEDINSFLKTWGKSHELPVGAAGSATTLFEAPDAPHVNCPDLATAVAALIAIFLARNGSAPAQANVNGPNP